jgi:lipoyl(octanoyl) transferase
MQDIYFSDLGLLDYKAAWELQEKLLSRNTESKAALRNIQSGKQHPGELLPSTRNYLLFVEHPPVYTLGKSGREEHVLIGQEEREARGIAFYHINRGGDITFHGPGQLVGYPIIDLEKFFTDIGRYLRSLEEVIILTLADYGLKGERSPGETGVWLDPGLAGSERKICAMGIRCSRWVTMHGFAFNINNDLSYFDHIIPCGIRGKGVTSVQKELGKPVSMGEIKENLKFNFEKVFGVKILPQQTPAKILLE